jgi:hypothetical protein
VARICEYNPRVVFGCTKLLSRVIGSSHRTFACRVSAGIGCSISCQRSCVQRAYSTKPPEIYAMNNLSPLPLVLLLLVIAATAVQGQRDTQFGKRIPSKKSRTAIAPWYVFRSPDDDFVIKFPDKPRLEEGGAVEGEVAVKRRYSYYGNSLWLSVTFQDLGFPPDSRQANDLGPDIEKIMATYTIERGGKAIRVQRLAKNILEEERIVPSRWSNANRHVITRYIQRNSRMYILGCVPLVDGQKIYKKTCRRFLNSFHIVGIPQ